MDVVIKKLSDFQTFLKFTYGILAIVAGADKFTNLLTDWHEYLNPVLAGMVPFSSDTFMILVGSIEIIAGTIVLLRPKIGAYIISGWLVLIAITLLSSGRYFDVAVRDVVMAVGAFSLALLSGITASVKVTPA